MNFNSDKENNMTRIESASLFSDLAELLSREFISTADAARVARLVTILAQREGTSRAAILELARTAW